MNENRVIWTAACPTRKPYECYKVRVERPCSILKDGVTADNALFIVSTSPSNWAQPVWLSAVERALISRQRVEFLADNRSMSGWLNRSGRRVRHNKSSHPQYWRSRWRKRPQLLGFPQKKRRINDHHWDIRGTWRFSVQEWRIRSLLFL